MVEDCFGDKMLKKSYYTSDNKSQQIDGAFQLCGRIFLLEIKWENNDTLSASDYYSFLGKINSKMDGTLGVFISYNKLKDNFINSVRNGVGQKCLVIHGEDSILDIIYERVKIDEYIEWLYKRASFDNVISLPTSDFLADPKKNKNSSNASTKQNDAVMVATAMVDSNTDIVHFNLCIEKACKSELINNLKVILDSYLYSKYINPTLKTKFERFVSEILPVDKALLQNKIVDYFSEHEWSLYSNESFCQILMDKGVFEGYDGDLSIVDNLCESLEEEIGNWENENYITNILDVFYKYLPREKMTKLGYVYYDIYIDKNRQDKFAQKKFANKLAEDLGEDWKDIAAKKVKMYLNDSIAKMEFSGEDKDDVINYVSHRFDCNLFGKEKRGIINMCGSI